MRRSENVILVFLKNASFQALRFGKMENLSSSELDSPSKTPLFIAIAAVILALASLALGWMGFSSAAKLEKEIARLEAAAEQDSGLEAAVQENAERVDKLSGSVNAFSKSVNDAISGVRSDMTKIRSDLRGITIDAKTALKKVEELEEKGVQVSVVPTASRSSSAASTADAKNPDTKPGKSGVYTIKSGDYFSKIAAAYKISLAELEAANPGVDSRRLRIGQQINIPAPSN